MRGTGMPRPRNPIPTYRLHKPTGQAVVTLCTDEGRKDVYLGDYNSEKAKAECVRILGEMRAATPATVFQRLASARVDVKRPSVNEILLAFLRFTDGHYRATDGSETRELSAYRQCCRVVREMYGHKQADEFGPVALKAVRQK